MKHKLSAVASVLLLAAAAAVIVWIAFARPDAGPDGRGSAEGSPSAGARPTASPTPTFEVPDKLVDPLKGSSYCATVKLLGVYAHQPYGLDSDLALVKGRQFGKRLDVLAATYRKLAVQAGKQPAAGAKTPQAWRTMASAITAAGEKLRVTGYDVQSQVMIVELAKVAKATQKYLPTATATLVPACGATRKALGL